MRLLHYTIIIWMSLVQAAEFEPIHFGSIYEPPLRPHRDPYPEPYREPLKPIHPIEPVKPGKPIIEPIDPTGGSHPKPFKPLPKPIHEPPVHGGSDAHTGQVELPPSVPKSVQTYLNQHGQLPEVLRRVQLPKDVGITVEQVRTQYLEQIQKSFDKKGLITIPSAVLTGADSFIQKGVGPSLVTWMVSLTDGFSFAEHLAQSPTATDAQRQQFLFSAEKKAAYEAAKTVLVQSGQDLLEMVASLHKQYTDLFVMGNKIKNFTQQEVKGFSKNIDALNALLESSLERRQALAALVCKESPSYAEGMVSAVIDPGPALEAWNAQEQFSEQNAKLVFSSYDTFMSGFLTAPNVKEYVQTFIGSQAGKFVSVQALITALDKIGFILESKNFWLSFRNQKYSKKVVDTILSSLVKEYPDTYIPSKKFILEYCKLHRTFKSVSFFIPQYEQFLIDAKTLTIDELAKKYGQEPEFIKSLLNNTYEAVYVLQQTNQDKQARDLNEIVRRILLEHPEMNPAMVAQVIASENTPIQTLFGAEGQFARLAMGLRNEIVTLQAGQFQKSLTGLSAELSKVQTFIRNSFSRAESFIIDKAADGVTALVRSSRLGKVLTGVLEQLQKATSSFEIVSRVKENISIYSSAGSAQYQEAFEQLQSIKQDAMVFAVQVEYEKARAQQDRFSAQLLTILQDAIKRELLSYTPDYFTNVLFEITTSLKSEPLADEHSMDADGGTQTDTLISKIADTSVLERENEKDYQACIWASNKMGMMESKIMSISALLKIKKTPLFLAGYKSALKDLEADFLFLATSKSVQKCLNVIAERSFLSKKLTDLEKDVKDLQEKIDDEQHLKSGSPHKNKDA